MSLDVSLTRKQPTEVFEANITHNLGAMAREAGIYQHLWHPEEIEVRQAWQLIKPLRAGIAAMKANPSHFEKFDAENGWGTYNQFLPWLEQYLAACEKYPDADVSVSR